MREGESISWKPTWEGTIAGIRVAVSETGEVAIDARPEEYETELAALGPVGKALACDRLSALIAFADMVAARGATCPDASVLEALWRTLVDETRVA